MDGQVLFLGTGASSGTPIIGCKCSVCSSKEKRDNRLRSCILLKIGSYHILVDASPDLRACALTYAIEKIDYCFLSHMHFDHIAGVDDLRAFHFFQGQKPKVIMQESMKESFLKRYRYLDKHLEFTFLKSIEGKYMIESHEFFYFSYRHAGMTVMGLRFNNFAYLTDIKEYDQTIFDHLKGVDTLVIAATRISKSSLHLSVDEAIEFADKLKAKKVFLTHLGHEICHKSVSKQLPEHCFLAYDGLKLSI